MTDLVSLFIQKQIFAYLPYLAVSDMLSEPHLFIYLFVLACNVLETGYSNIHVLTLIGYIFNFKYINMVHFCWCGLSNLQ